MYMYRFFKTAFCVNMDLSHGNLPSFTPDKMSFLISSSYKEYPLMICKVNVALPIKTEMKHLREKDKNTYNEAYCLNFFTRCLHKTETPQ